MAEPTFQGPCGGFSGGNPYNLSFPGPVASMNVWSTGNYNGQVINIEFVFPENEASETSPSLWVGNPTNTGGTFSSIAPPVGTTLVGVSGFYSGIVNAIAFIWSDGTSSETFGPTNNAGQIAFALSIPKGATLSGVFGNVGSQVNTIGLNYSPAQY